MTREESIKILDPKTSRDALMEFMGGSWDQTQALTLIGEAQKMGLDALRTQQFTTKLDRSQWEGCWSCNNLKIRELGLRHSREYCPGCGKPLTGWALAELERRIRGCNGTNDI